MNSTTRNGLSVTFYEREYNSSSPALNATMEINMFSVENVNIPNIERPMKIDIWNDGNGNDVDYWLEQLTLRSPSHQFTFECNCNLGIDGNKKTLFPKEDEWEITITSFALWHITSKNNFTIVILDKNGGSQEIDSSFKRGNTTTTTVIFHLEDPVSYTTLSFEGFGHGQCIKLAFTHNKTCRIYQFRCWYHSEISKTIEIQSTDIMENCLPSTTTTTLAPTTGSPTITTTLAPTTGSPTTTTTVAPTTDSPTTTTTVAPTTGSPTTATTVAPTTGSSTTTNNVAPTTGSPTTTTTVAPTAGSPITIPFTTRPTTTTSHTTTSVQSNLSCCLCGRRKPMINLTSSQLQTIVMELQSQLSVNKSSLSSTVRKKTCATDNRPSSKAIGMTGAVFLVIPFILLVICDLSRLICRRPTVITVYTYTSIIYQDF